MAVLSALLRALAVDARGGVTTIGALSLTSVVGMSGLAMEVGHGYAQKVANQRVADAAALAAGLAYAAASDASLILPTAQAIARANGLPASAVAAPAPTTDAQGRTLISVTVTVPVSLYLSRVLTSRSAYDVRATGVAAVTAGGSSSSTSASPAGCIIALDRDGNGKGLFMRGGVSINAGSCAVQANYPIHLTNGPVLTAKQIVSGSTISAVAGSTINGEKIENRSNAANDPFNGNATLSARLAAIGSYAPPAAIGNPTTPAGADWNFDWNGNAAVQAFKTSGGNFTVPAGNHTVGRLTVGGGVTVRFAAGANLTIAGGFQSGGNVYLGTSGSWKVNGGFDTGWGTFSPGSVGFHLGSGTITFTGNTLTFGNGDMIFNGPLSVSGQTQVVFGAGNHSFTAVSVTGSSQLTLGAGNLNVTGRVYLEGSSEMRVGDGDVTIGNASGTSIQLEASGKLYLGAGRFSTSGHIVTKPGSILTIGPATNHYINGNLDLQGSVNFSAGAYTVNGNFTNNNSGTMAGTNVSFYLNGIFNLGGGAALDLRAPTSTIGETMADLLIATRSASATFFGYGAQMTLQGVLYAPNSAMTMDGGAQINNGGGCFQLIASSITLLAGATTATSCPGTSTTTTVTTQTPATVALVR